MSHKTASELIQEEINKENIRKRWLRKSELKSIKEMERVKNPPSYLSMC